VADQSTRQIHRCAKTRFVSDERLSFADKLDEAVTGNAEIDGQRALRHRFVAVVYSFHRKSKLVNNAGCFADPPSLPSG